MDNTDENLLWIFSACYCQTFNLLKNMLKEFLTRSKIQGASNIIISIFQFQNRPLHWKAWIVNLLGK